MSKLEVLTNAGLIIGFGFTLTGIMQSLDPASSSSSGIILFCSGALIVFVSAILGDSTSE